MMPKVHVLPPDIISKIAAGEVIDRPASVVKELMENAIDAEADVIDIALADAGKTSITIKDNGTGIGHEDIDKIFERHSTSKIKTANDLFDIRSLGFRGEALYSICAVADITVKSKTADTDSGWEIHRRGGEHLSLKPIPMTNGTEIEVKELFFNTPARRKFLKSNASEMNQILNIVIPYTLLYPQCAFTVTHGNKTLLDIKKTENIIQRCADVLNLEKDFILKTRREFPEDMMTISMVLGDINIMRSKRDMQFIFINGRPVHNSSISFHLNDVYRLIFPPKKYPFFALNITLPADNVDVNIHPTKREVKIKDEPHLCSLLRRICENTLMNAGKPKQIWEPDISEETPERPSPKKMISKALKEREQIDADIEQTFASSAAAQAPTEQYTFPVTEQKRDFNEHVFSQRQNSLREKLASSYFIGGFINKYLFFGSGKTLLIIDQHAAQERIMFEHFIRQMQDSVIEVQNLLTPYLIKVSAQDMLNWQENKERLTEIGFDTTQFDNETVAIQSHPAVIQHPEDAVKELLAHGDTARCDHDTIARRACRASVMAGDALTKDQAEFQKEQLLQCSDPFTCPHGRPIVIEMTSDFLDKQFLRT